jgi:drug/metabolite transporter (DMT)-like permease
LRFRSCRNADKVRAREQGEVGVAETESAGSSRLALAALILGAVALGTSPLFVRIAETGPTATGFWRMLLALIPVYAVIRLAPGGGRLRAGDAPAFFWPALMFGADLFFWQWAIHYTTMASATLLSNLAPVVVTLGAWLILRERITGRFLLGGAVALGGAALLMSGNAAQGERFLWGDLMGALSAVFYGAYLLFVARLRDRFSTAVLTFWYSAICAALLLPVAVLTGDRLLSETPSGWLTLFGLAFISHALGQGLIAYAFGHLPASFSSLVILIQPVVAALLGWVLLGEGQGAWQMAVGALVLAGIVVARGASARR